MIPVHLDPKLVRIGLVGRDGLTVRRLAWLRAGGAEPTVWSDAPNPALLEVAPDLIAGLPTSQDLAGFGAVWIADLPVAQAQPIAAAARAIGVLVNVEDVLAYCDFHTPAVVRRGRLTLSAGTGGASPALARAARERMAAAFPEQWEQALDEVAQSRLALRAQGAEPAAVIADAQARLSRLSLD
jgi:precorrin-2 dehydrogenase / sirohydrochlorin ferrochelatase